MKKIFLLTCALLLGALYSSAQTSGVTGEWRGIWTNPTGFVFSAELTLAGVYCGYAPETVRIPSKSFHP